MIGRGAGYAALVAAAACWGSTIVLIEVASRGLSVAALTTVELVVAAGVLSALLFYRGSRGRRPRLTARIALAGVLEPGIAYVCINAGIAKTSGTHAALLLGTESIFVVALSAALVRRLPAAVMTVGLVIAVAGAGLIADSRGSGASWSGDLLVLAGALAAALYVVIAQPISGTLDALDLTAYQFLIGTLVSLPLALVVGGRVSLGPHPRPEYWLDAGLVGLLGSVAAFALYNWALRRTTPAAAGGSLTLIPVFGLIFSILFLGDPLSLRTVLAAGAVLLGLTLITVSESRSAPSPETDEAVVPAGP